MKTFEDKINSLIGQPYNKHTAHCWDLVEFLIPFAPKAEGVAQSLRVSVKHFDRELKKHNLNEILNEKDFENKDIIVMGKDGIFYHAGVYYDGGVVHAQEGGATYTPLDMIKKMYSDFKGLRV